MSAVRTLPPSRLHLTAIWLMAAFLAVALAGGTAARADHEPPADQARIVQQALLTAPQARAASDFTGRLSADPMAGQSCYRGTQAWTCDAWFTTDQYTRPYPNGVAITVTPDRSPAERELVRLAGMEPDPNRPGSRVLRSSSSTLIVLTTGFAVGTNLAPAVAVSVTTVQGRYLVMGSCQVQRKQLKLTTLRACATNLQGTQVASAKRVLN